MKELLILKVNKRGALTIHLPNGEQLQGINGIKVKQDLSKMKSGFAEVKLSMLVRTKDAVEQQHKENSIDKYIKTLSPERQKELSDNKMTNQEQKPQE